MKYFYLYPEILKRNYPDLRDRLHTVMTEGKYCMTDIELDIRVRKSYLKLVDNLIHIANSVGFDLSLERLENVVAASGIEEIVQEIEEQHLKSC